MILNAKNYGRYILSNSYMKLIKKPEIVEVPLLSEYTNGNYKVKLFTNGTKIRTTDENSFSSEFPESMDVKLTNRCSARCQFCHEASTPEGDQADLNHPLFDTLQSGTELALGGGNLFEHPNLEQFLIKLKDKGIITNITVNQVHFEENLDKINQWQKDKLIWGVGISYNGSSEKLKELYFKTYNPNNVVVHVIAGIHNLDDLSDKRFKILILGYKILRRGLNFYDKYSESIQTNIESLKTNINKYLNYFKVTSFDNLALEQLDIENQVEPDFYKLHYMGGDGCHTMYIDMVKREFARSSTSMARYSLDNHDNIKSIFKVILDETN